MSSLPPFLIRECTAAVSPDPDLEKKAQAHLDSLTKPVGSLGRLEKLAARLCALQDGAAPAARPARMITIAADHGVVAEGVASHPQEVTRLMVLNFLNGGAAINVLCRAAGAELLVVDAGVACEPFAPHPLLFDAKIARGTANMAKGPAMTAEQCAAALKLGIQLAENARKDGVKVLGTGEMGIGNTTASSALFCAYLGFSPSEVTGMGAGVPKAGLEHKALVISRALRANQDALDSGDPFAVLAALGGLEIAALAGLIIGAASRHMAVVVDGFISTAAFAAAMQLTPAVDGCCFFAHGSAEAGHGKVLERLGVRPLLNLGLRLGEGTGAALAFHLLEAAARIYNDMATLDGAGINIGPGVS